MALGSGVRVTMHPLRTLKHEHRVIERALRALAGVCARLQWGQRVPAEVLSQLVNFISEFADRYHHGKEEAYFFPFLERHGFVRSGGPLGAIEREHKIESELTREMHDAAEGYTEVDTVARQRFIDSARRYIAHLLSHIDKEDAILLRLADEILDEEDKALLSEGFKQADAKFGAGANEEYDAIATTLEKEWAL